MLIYNTLTFLNINKIHNIYLGILPIDTYVFSLNTRSLEQRETDVAQLE